MIPSTKEPTMKQDQYVIVKLKDDKPVLAQIQRVNADGIVAFVEKDRHLRKQSIRFNKKDVKVNLGLRPFPGRAYGFDLSNLYRKTIEHDFWGNIHFFIELEKPVLNMLKHSLDRTAERVTKLKLAPYTNLFETEIKSKHGKYAGMYIHSKGEERPNMVWFAPECADNQPEVMDNLVYHEFGHVIRFNGIRQNKLRNKWLRLYQRSIAPVKIGKNVLASILNDMDEYDEQEESFGQVFGALTEDHGVRIQKAILQWFKQTHKVSNKELEIMWRSSKIKDLERLWPDHTVDTHDLKPVVTEYATKNCEELFAESFAFYAQKKKLPSKIEELLETSLSVARADVGD
jgi:hypothetical protein